MCIVCSPRWAVKCSLIISQQTRDIHPLLYQCWPTVFDAGPTLKQHWVNVPCLLGWPVIHLCSRLTHVPPHSPASKRGHLDLAGNVFFLLIMHGFHPFDDILADLWLSPLTDFLKREIQNGRHTITKVIIYSSIFVARPSYFHQTMFSLSKNTMTPLSTYFKINIISEILH